MAMCSLKATPYWVEERAWISWAWRCSLMPRVPSLRTWTIVALLSLSSPSLLYPHLISPIIISCVDTRISIPLRSQCWWNWSEVRLACSLVILVYFLNIQNLCSRTGVQTVHQTLSCISGWPFPVALQLEHVFFFFFGAIWPSSVQARAKWPCWICTECLGEKEVLVGRRVLVV